MLWNKTRILSTRWVYRNVGGFTTKKPNSIISTSRSSHRAFLSSSITSFNFLLNDDAYVYNRWKSLMPSHRLSSTTTDKTVGLTDESIIVREEMPFDILIVGSGPAGLSAAIRIKQLCIEKDINLSVCIVEKGSEVGAHILSGNVRLCLRNDNYFFFYGYVRLHFSMCCWYI